MLYDSGKLEDVEYQIYLKWFDHFIDKQKIEKVVYLKTDPKICLHRINKRKRDGESNIPLEYLEKCHSYHEDMINKNIEEKLIIDTNIDTEDNLHMINVWLNMIENFIINNP
jgi:deoxyadenosine/deoxycytidine kinase